MFILFFLYLLVSTSHGRPQAGYNYRTPIGPTNLYGTPSIGANNVDGINELNSYTSSYTGDVSAGGNIGTNFVSNVGANIGETLPASINKHVYVFTAPEEEEVTQQRQIIGGGSHRKHYKIIFIKAPSSASYSQSVIAAQAQSQEKTLIYVLVKRPDELNDLTIPTGSAIKPSKPEVYYINYKSRASTTDGASALSGQSAITGPAPATGSDFPSAPNAAISTNYGVPGKSGPY